MPPLVGGRSEGQICGQYHTGPSAGQAAALNSFLALWTSYDVLDEVLPVGL